MKYRTRTLSKTGGFTLNHCRHTKTGKRYYTVALITSSFLLSFEKEEEIRSHFDPFKNRGKTNDPWMREWKFQTREEAEHLLSIAVLKGWA